MPALDIGPYDSTRDRAAAARNQARADIDRERLRQETLLEIARNQAAQQKLVTQDVEQKSRLPLAFGDVAANLLPESFPANADPTYQKANPLRVPFQKAPTEYRQRMFDAYGAAALPDIAREHDAQVGKLTGHIPGLDPQMEKVQQSVDEKGNISTHYKPRELGKVFPSVDDAEAAGLSAEGADVLPDGSIRITKAARADRTRPAQKAVDSKYATDFVEWETGGAADTAKSLAQLKGAKSSLESGRNITGPIIGIMPDWALAWTNPEAIQTREAVEEVVQRNLRAVLGGQFAQKEGEQLIRRAFNPKLSETENTARLNRLMGQIEAAAAAKSAAASYFRENGTLSGWEGKMPSIGDFNPDAPSTPEGKVPPAGQKQVPSEKPPVVRQNGNLYYLQPDGTYK